MAHDAPQLGKFIVIEGLDGAGTTTQTNLLWDWIDGRGDDVVPEREPTRNAIGLVIRRHFLGQSEFPAMDNIASDMSRSAALALLFAADRAIHSDTIRQMLEHGAHVVCDRYFLSSLAYQTSVVLNENWIFLINKTMARPDLTIFLDVRVKTCMERLKSRKNTDVFENEEHLERVDRKYRRFLSDRVLVGPTATVDGSQPIEDVHAAIVSLVTQLLAPKTASEKRIAS